MAGPSKGGHGRHRYVIAEDGRCSTRASTAAIENDVVDADVEGCVDVGFDMLGGQLGPNGNTAACFSHRSSDFAIVLDGGEVGKGGWGYGWFAFVQAAYFCDPAGDLMAGKMATGTGLCSLAELEVKGLHLCDLVDIPAEPPRGQFVEVTTVGLLFLGQHASFAGADSRAGQLRTFGQGHLGFFGQRPKTHIGHEERNVEFERCRGVAPDRYPRAHFDVVEQRPPRQLCGDDLDVVPLRKLVTRDTHGRYRTVVAELR